MNSWDEALASLSQEDWQAIKSMNAEIQGHDGSWGEFKGGDKDASGTVQMPYVELDPLVYRFSELWYAKNLIVAFDWSHWEDGRQWFADTSDTKYDKLDQETALKLLTAIIRNDRFNEGALLHAFEDGTVPKIIDRLVSLNHE